MSVVINYGLTFEEARARGADVYYAWLEAWGSRLGLPDPFTPSEDAYPDWTLPPLPATIAGIAIGPESDVDRVWLATNSSKALLASADVTPARGVREVSVDRPLIFSQPAKIDAPIYAAIPAANEAAYAYARGDLYVFAQNDIGFRADTTVIPPTYIKTDGTTPPLNDVTNLNILYPRLQLELILKEGVVPTTKRCRQRWGNSDNSQTAFDQAEITIKIIPIYGRKHVSVTLRATNNNAATVVTFRIAVLRTLGYVNIPSEDTVGLKTATVGANGGFANFSFCNLDADFIILYVTGDQDGSHVTNWVVASSD